MMLKFVKMTQKDHTTIYIKASDVTKVLVRIEHAIIEEAHPYLKQMRRVTRYRFEVCLSDGNSIYSVKHEDKSLMEEELSEFMNQFNDSVCLETSINKQKAGKG